MLLAACASPAEPSARQTPPPIHLETEGPPVPAGALAATVSEIIDGDTVLLEIDGRRETVRLLGIDTPEKPGGPRPAECFGDQASAFADKLIPAGTPVLLSGDRATRDQYGRLLAFVHRDDGLFVNLAMVELGYATPLFFAPNTSMRDTFELAADTARREWRGFWPACGAADLVLTE